MDGRGRKLRTLRQHSQGKVSGIIDGLRAALRAVPAVRGGTGTAIALSVIAGFWTIGAVHGGRADHVIADASSAMGFSASGLTITGQAYTSDNEIVAALSWPEGGSLVGFDVGAARQRLSALPWVEEVSLRKIYSGQMGVAIVEKKPAAVWQANEKRWVIDGAGNKIAAFGIADILNDRFSHLPHLVGEGAAEGAQEVLPLIAKHPQIAGRVQAYLRVGERRWDLLVSGRGDAVVRVMLPEHGLTKAVEKLAALQSDRQIVDRQISAVDMRLADRVVFDLEPEAASARAELVKQRKKAIKRLVRDATERPV